MKDCIDQARIDAQNIFSNYEEEIVEALESWGHNADEEFEVGDTTMWVNEGHALSGIVLDLEQACETLCDIPAELHETDKGLWEEETITGTVRSMAIATYEKIVLHNFHDLLEKLVELPPPAENESYRSMYRKFLASL